MRVLLADIASADGFVHKDTIVGGYGSRLRPFSRVTRLGCALKRRLNDVPSVTLASLAAILDAAGHDVRFTRGAVEDADVALVLSSLVDHRNETRTADALRDRGIKVGFVGLAASTLPQLFAPHADFLIMGEPEEGVQRLAAGAALAGLCPSQELADLDALPFPRWDLVGVGTTRRASSRVFTRPIGGLPVLASRSCPESCTYCPHRILAGHRSRSVASLLDELAGLCARYERPFIIFRDPLFSHDRERVLALCDGILGRRLELRFECETRLDCLDEALLRRMRQAGLRTIAFGVESPASETLRAVGRRPIDDSRQRGVVEACARLGIRTVAFYVLGFPSDSWDSVAATIEHAIALGSTLAQFKLLTPYPGTPLFKQLRARIVETDWQAFDGFTPTFAHPSLARHELEFLLAAAYARFYLRPSFVTTLARAEAAWLRRIVRRLDRMAGHLHARHEAAAMLRAVQC